MSYNDRVEAWAERNSRSLKILYCIWITVLVVVVMSFAFGVFDNITFDANKIPVGFMDSRNIDLWYMPSCPDGTVGIVTDDDPLYNNMQTCYDEVTMIELQCGVNKLASGNEVSIGCIVP